MNWADKKKIGRYFFEQVHHALRNRIQSVQHQGISLNFALPNDLNRFRIETFSTKEPETLEWIDQIPRDAVLWDIGANVGLYTCYAAKARNCKVFAFEPSVFNLELLARNISLNELIHQVTIIPLPLSDELVMSTLHLTSMEWGGALSTFSKQYGHDGQTLQKVFEYKTLGLSMMDAVKSLKIPQPEYIKIDVDGIEHLILRGGLSILKQVKSILIEINDQFDEQRTNAEKYLKEAGLFLKEKRHAEMFEGTVHQHAYNQIWHR